MSFLPWILAPTLVFTALLFLLRAWLMKRTDKYAAYHLMMTLTKWASILFAVLLIVVSLLVPDLRPKWPFAVMFVVVFLYVSWRSHKLLRRLEERRKELGG